MKAERFFTHPAGVMVAATGATFLWGSAFPFVKLSYEELQIAPDEVFEQMVFAGYRFVLAALMIIIFHVVSSRKVGIQRGSGRALLKVGLFQTFLQYIFFYIGLSFSTGIRGSITVSTVTFFQLVLAHYMYKNDLLNWRKGVGLMIGFTGVILVNMTKGSLEFVFGLGEGLLLLAALSGAYGNILVKNESRDWDVLYLTGYQMLIGGIGLLVIGSVQAGFAPFHFSGKALWMLAYLAFLSAAGFMLWNNVMKYNKVGKVSMYMFFIPVSGVFLSVLLLHEPFHLFIALSLLLVVAGIIIVNRGEKKPDQGAAGVK